MWNESKPDAKQLESVAPASTSSAKGAPGTATQIFDPRAENNLRRKIDLYIVPPVALLYLFCFIDRANIGKIPDLELL